MQPQPIQWNQAAARLMAGEIGIVPTDTLYGVVGRAADPEVVQKIYDLRQREHHKPLIVLVGSMSDLPSLRVEVDQTVLNLLSKVWPGPVSVILPLLAPDMDYLHRGTQSLAVRLPGKPELRQLLQHTGPLVAPSANLAGERPSETVEQAYEYFGDQVFYLDGGTLAGSASALVDGRFSPVKVLRPAPGLKL